MTDIVEELRNYAGGRGTGRSLLDQAADEIERLRVELNEYKARSNGEVYGMRMQ